MTKTFIHNDELSRKRLTWCLIIQQEDDDMTPNKAFLYPQSVMEKQEFSNYIDFDNIESYLRGKEYKNIKKKSATEYLFGNKPLCDYYKRISKMAEEFCDNYASFIVQNKNLCSKHYESV